MSAATALPQGAGYGVVVGVGGSFYSALMDRADCVFRLLLRLRDDGPFISPEQIHQVLYQAI